MCNSSKLSIYSIKRISGESIISLKGENVLYEAVLCPSNWSKTMLYLAADRNITVNQFTFRRVLFIKCLFSNWKENTKCRSVRKPNEAARHEK